MTSASTVPPSDEIYRAIRRRTFRRFNEVIIVGILALFATISLVITVLIVLELFVETKAFFDEVSITRFLFTDGRWQPVIGEGQFRIWDLVAGTLNVVVWALVVAVPVGLATAVYLSEYASPRVRKTLKPILEALAGVPTVVYAFFALTFITPNLLQPIFGSEVKNFNALGASLMLAVMVLPTIASISEDAMSNVPRELREGAYALGSTRLEVSFRVVFPAALSGIIASILLAIARVIGETMIVAVAAGSTPRLTINPLDSVQTMTGYMLQIGLGDAARGTAQYTSLFAVGFSLFLMTLFTNLVALWFVRRYREEYE